MAILPFRLQPAVDRQARGTRSTQTREGETPPEVKPGTNIAAAIEAAAASLPPGYVPQRRAAQRRQRNAGDAPAKPPCERTCPFPRCRCRRAASRKCRSRPSTLPAQVRQGEPFYVEVVIDANHDDEGLMTGLSRRSRGRQREAADQEGREPLPLSADRSTSERLAHYSARVQRLASDTLLDNNAESGLVFTPPASRGC